MYSYNNNQAVLPLELSTIYKEFLNSNKKHELDLKKMQLYLEAYFKIYAVIEVKFIENVFINEYHFDVTKEDIEKMAHKCELVIYKDYYVYKKQSLEAIDLIINNKLKILKELKLNNAVYQEEELIEYIDYLKDLGRKLLKYLGKYGKLIDYIVDQVCYFYKNSIEIIKEYLDDIKIPTKNKEKILEIVKDNLDCIKISYLNGRSYQDIELSNYLDKNLLKEKPKKLTFKECLKKLSSNNLEEFKLEEILENVKKLDEEGMNLLVDSNLKTINEVSFYNKYKLYQFMFFYEDKDTIRIIVPDEVLELINSSNIDNNYLVSNYLHMNGVLEKKKLQEFLKEYHNVDIEIEELDRLVLKNRYYIKNNYYFVMQNIPYEDLESVWKIKCNKKFREIDVDSCYKSIEYENKLRSIIKDDIILGMIICKSYLDGVKKSFFDTLKEDGHIVNSKLASEIMNLYNEYKDSIPCWVNNGYPVTNNQVVKKVKIGRNDKCPCGSGKKYKNCCLGKD